MLMDSPHLKVFDPGASFSTRNDASMSLYEITTGMHGESYVRAYAWAESSGQASQLFRAAYPSKEAYPNKCAFKVQRLFDHDAMPFVTKLSDSGWEK